ncbi:S-formylglutathione hydrolase [Aquabacterium sp.]|uniref:S-formylglutathione hydrolase n=1 Tax=Aquabacterium sp. TaxID=1872578 RepID=UPI0025C10834|nr:S-formylglutathione hydrolase [Aquabacterium sp.]
MSTLELLSAHGCFGGVQRFYRHASAAIGLPMQFGVYLPPQALEPGAKVPVLFYLAGLTCTEETFAIKAGAQAHAARLGLAIVTPDTSPRGAEIDGEADDWDFGVGAGFYLNATEAPWDANWQMERYITQELHALVEHHLPVDMDRVGIFGHSMGGHGALTLALRNPGLYRSVSAFAPIAAPSQCPWGQKAFTGYLGPDRGPWAAHDACALMGEYPMPPYPDGILIDQGLADKFLPTQLHPEQFEAACARIGQPLTLRRHEGYDHGYYFIQSFVADHLAHHAQALAQA